MAVEIFKFIFIEALIYQVMASYLQQTQQYYQMPGQQYYQIPSAPIPSGSMPRSNTYASLMTATRQPAIPSPYIDYSSYSTVTPATSYKTPVSPLLQSQLTNSITKSIEPNIFPTPPSLDTNVLNNLAIALQLLIVSNLLNLPIQEKISNDIHTTTCQSKRNEYESANTINSVPNYLASTTTLNSLPGLNELPLSQSYSSHLQPNEYKVYFESNPCDQPLNSQSSFPNANYLGSSQSLGGLLGSLGVPPASTRPGLNLKSPYDALASGPCTGNLPSTSLKNDFQSPFAAILAADNYKDLFSFDF